MMMGICYEALMRWTGPAATVSARGVASVAAHGDMPTALALHGTLRRDGALYQMSLSDSCGLARALQFSLHGSEATCVLDVVAGTVSCKSCFATALFVDAC